MLRSQRLLISISGVLLLLIVLQIWRQREQVVRATDLGIERAGLPREGIADNDTLGQVPGDPTATANKAKVIYQCINTYRKYHQGSYPADAAALIFDATNNFKQYGAASESQLMLEFESPDNQYADDPRKRASESVIPWVICPERPDGTAMGGQRPTGTRDVLAYTSLYYHEEARHFNGIKDTINPVGFYIVLWDDGQVQEVPYYDKLFVHRIGTNRYYTAFPGGAGVPSTALKYDEMYRNVARGNLPPS